MMRRHGLRWTPRAERVAIACALVGGALLGFLSGPYCWCPA